MHDNVDTDPSVVFAVFSDGRNAVLNVGNQESLGLVTAGIAPAIGSSGSPSSVAGGWVNFQAAEAVTIPGQFSDSPIFTGGDGGGGSTGDGSGGYGGDSGNSRTRFQELLDDIPGDNNFDL